MLRITRQRERVSAQCRERGKLAFRLFPWRGGALTACGRPTLPPRHGNSLGSQRARPTVSAMLVKKLETFVPDDFLIRAGGERAKAAFSSNGLGLRRALPAPAKEPKVPWILLLLPPLRTNAASSPDAGASRDHRGAAPSVRSSPAPETQTQRSSRHHGGADRVAQARQQLRAGSACRSGCLNCILQFKFARKLARPPDCVRNARQKIGDFRP